MNVKRLAFIPLLLTLAACGSAGRTEAPAPSAPPSLAQAKPATATADSTGSIASRSVGAPAQAGAAAKAAQPAGAPAQAQAFQGAAALQPLPPLNRMVIKNANLSISVDDPDASLSEVDRIVRSVPEAAIASQTVRTQNDKTFVNMTIQVPPGSFEETLAKLRDLRARGTHVLNDTVSSQDVTEQFVDLDAQHRNLQTTRDAYQKLLDKATAVSDIIQLTREVANIQTQMDQIKGRQNLIAKQSAISTITLSLSPIGATPPGPKPLPKPVQAAQEAWQALLTGLQGFAVVLIWMGILLPVPALVLLTGWLIYRRATRPAAPGTDRSQAAAAAAE